MPATRRTLLLPCLLGLALSMPLAARADGVRGGGVYTAVGVPGLIAGYALPVTNTLVVRADLSTLGSQSWTGNESGNEYQGKIKFNRLALLGDYHFADNWRVTGGLTLQHGRLDIHSSGAGLTSVGDTAVTLQPGDSFDAAIKFPRFTPYLGVGFGRYAGTPQGWNLVGDAGVMVGKSKVSGGLSGPSAALVSQTDVDKELQKVRDGVGKVKVIPQLTLGASYQY
jgi:hypothetical protein